MEVLWLPSELISSLEVLVGFGHVLAQNALLYDKRIFLLGEILDDSIKGHEQSVIAEIKFWKYCFVKIVEKFI